jgi:hypothetical protein
MPAIVDKIAQVVRLVEELLRPAPAPVRVPVPIPVTPERRRR